MALLPNGNALAAGGYIGAFSGTTAADVYNYTSNVWNATGRMLNTTYGRYYHEMQLLPAA